jgi:hypothetical protein
MCGFQTNLQQFHNGFGMQGRPFHQIAIVMEFIADDLQDFIDWHIGEDADSVKSNKKIKILGVNRLQL